MVRNTVRPKRSFYSVLSLTRLFLENRVVHVPVPQSQLGAVLVAVPALFHTVSLNALEQGAKRLLVLLENRFFLPPQAFSHFASCFFDFFSFQGFCLMAELFGLGVQPETSHDFFLFPQVKELF